MSETQNNLAERVTNLESSMGDVKSALNQLIDYSVQNDRRLTNTIDRLAQVVQTLAERQGTYEERTDSAIASINAAVERLDRILDYLIQRDGERN